MVSPRFSGVPQCLLLLSALPLLLQAQTAVTLRTSQPPSRLGAPVVLTATLAPLTATGRVTFYDGVTMLGIAPVVAGAASVSTGLLPSGSHKLTAYYAGDAANGAATSNVVAQTVNAQPAIGTFARGRPMPTGFGAVVADFNGDGNADIAFNPQEISLEVLLGQGDGTFKTLPTTLSIDIVPAAVGDFNGDGKPDLVVGDTFNHQLGILLGKGDGTFETSVTVIATTAVTFFPSVAVGDFNGDGKADIAFTDPHTGVTILLGKGDGTFQPAVTYPASLIGGVGAILVKMGDFNGDGKADLATTISNNASVSILLGNGDGTFQPPHSVTVPEPAVSLVAEDLNKDGMTDLAIGQRDNPLVSILLGKGDGTFQPAVSYPISGIASSLAVGDFNGDGNADLAASGLSILLGNGDGTFQSPINQTVASAFDLVVGEFNGDGKTDLVTNGGLLLGTTMSFTLVGGTPQSTMIGTPFPNPIEVMLRDSGSPVSGATVAFCSFFEGSLPCIPVPPPPIFIGPTAVLSSTSAVTDASGIASVTATANLTAGSYVITAVYQGSVSQGMFTVPFSLTNVGAPFRMTVLGGTPQFGAIGAVFGNALQVTLRDSAGGPVSGVTVTFTTPASGPTAMLSSPTAVTDANGVASVTATANATLGSYTVTARVGTLSAAFSLTNVSAGRSNLALGKTATQSSTFPGFATDGASGAVDGNTDGNFADGSVTATNLDTNAWWQVDLGAVSTVNSIIIWNRTDCCGSRLGDYWVFVSNTPFLPTDTPSTLQNRTGTFSSHQTAAPNPFTIVAAGSGVQGRYVRVQLNGADYLSLAEVQVLGTPGSVSPNLALGKTATQSSTLGYPTAGAASAVDGNTEGNFSFGSVTATNLDTNAWWQVDLAASAAISSVVIWNRTDCCSTRLSDYWVFISDTPFLPTDTPSTLQGRAGTFGSHQAGSVNPTTVIVAGVEGRYVRVQLTGANYLSLAEVQVLGTPASGSSNLAQGKTATQSSTFPGYATDGAAAAVDGNTDGNFFDGSVTATNADPNAWWQVDLGASSSISSIVISNRTDCCGSRLNDYWVFVSDTPFLPTDTPATLSTRAGINAYHPTTVPNPSTIIPGTVQGRYVRIQLTGTNYLSLAEVQVFGQ